MKTTMDYMFEWGKNCATLNYTEEQSRKALEAFGEFYYDQRAYFWRGFLDGPRAAGKLVSIPASLLGTAKEEQV